MRRAAARRAPLLLALLGAGLAGRPGALAQPPPPAAPAGSTPTFGRGVGVVRVDVVVTDKDGTPLRGIPREEFTLLDNGKPRAIETFESVELAPTGTPAAGAPKAALPRVVDNRAPAAGTDTSRTVVVVFDDLNLTSESAPRAKAGVAAFLDSGVRDGDRVTIVATGGGTWWSTRMPAGREDVTAILKALTGRRVRTNVRDAITDYEAMRVYVFNDTQVENRVRQRFDTYGVTSQSESRQARENRDVYSRGTADPYVQRRAAEEYLKTRARNRVTLSALLRAIQSVSSSRERKTILLASDGFVYDTQEDAFRKVTEAARRANAVVHFLDARGLQAPTLYSAQFDAMPVSDSSGVGAVLADSTMDAEGSEALALDTGGYAIRSTNDLTDGARRIAQQSRVYYLLGFTPDETRDGRFHKLEVKLRRKGLNVRARKGYYALADDAPAPNIGDRDPVFQEALDAAEFRPGLPLRMTAYVLGEQALGKVHALVVCEVDVSKVAYTEKEGALRGSLDVLFVVGGREGGEFSRYDQKIDLTRRAGSVAKGASWYPVAREFDLPPGRQQARIVVRDAGNQTVGSLAYDFDVPAPGTFRIATPVLTDTVQPNAQGVPQPVVVARRTFSAGRPLVCRFDVFGATPGENRLPSVKAGHTLRRTDGTVVSASAPTAIEPTSLGALARLLAIPLDVPPGDYELVLSARDEIANRTSETVEPFTVE